MSTATSVSLSQRANALNERALAKHLADGPEACALAGQALVQALADGDLAQQAFAHLNLALCLLRDESAERGTDHLEQARKLLADVPEGQARVHRLADHVEGMRLRRLGRRPEAAAVLQKLDDLTRTERPLLDAYLTFSSLAVVLGVGDDSYESLSRFYEALALARRSGEPSLIVNALNNLGSFQLDQHNLEDALPLLQECLAGAIAIGSRRQTIFAAGNLVQCQSALGLGREALEVAQEHLIPKIGPEDAASLQRDDEIAYALMENGLLDEAEARLSGELRVDGVIDEVDTHRAWLQSRLLVARGRHREALQLCLAHKAECPGFGASPPIDQVRLSRLAAETAAALGEPEVAYAQLSDAYLVQEQLRARSARARYLSLQIANEVQRAAAERDAAQSTAQELEALNASLREQIAENQRLQEKLHSEAIEDPLTGLHNRRYLVDAGSGLLALAQRHEEPLSLALLDMDHFKLVNDRHGHEAGDRVLCAFAQLARRLMRASDVVCRYGGEEFVLLFALSDEAGALARLETMQAEFRALRFEDEAGSTFACTFSAGISGTGDGAGTLQGMLEWADKAMYMAKRRGRDRICRWSPPSSPQAGRVPKG